MMRLFVAVLLFAAAQAASLGWQRCSRGPSFWCRSLHSASTCHSVNFCLDTVWKSQLSHVKQTKVCEHSQKMITTVRHMLDKRNGHRAATPMIASMCSFIRGDSMRKECNGLVTHFLPEIFMLMERSVESSSVAVLLGLCETYEDRNDYKAPDTKGRPHYVNTNEVMKEAALKVGVQTFSVDLTAQKDMVENDMPKAQEDERQDAEIAAASAKDEEEEPVAASLPCSLCEMFVTKLDSLLRENSTKQAVQHALDDFCKELPESIATQCLSFVDEYAGVVVELLVQEELDPHSVCLWLRLCKSSAVPAAAELKVPARTSVEETASITCSVCKLVMSEVDQLIGENRTEAAVKSALDKVCGLLPATITAECQSYVNTYIAAIMDILVQEMDPTLICQELGLCTKSVQVSVALRDIEADGTKGSMECDLCKIILTEINKFVVDNTTEEAVIHLVEKVCDALQGDLKLKCKSEVENYGPAVLDLLRHMDDPTQVCNYLKLCGSTRKSVSSADNFGRVKRELLGGNPCTYGPDFWCANKANAARCNMVQECNDTYHVNL